MTTGTNRIMDEFAKLMTDAAGAAQGVRKEIETAFNAQAERWLNSMDIVKRERVRGRAGDGDQGTRRERGACRPHRSTRGEACRRGRLSPDTTQMRRCLHATRRIFLKKTR
ncbi:hypothetical protein ACVIDN_002652 [Rhizobium brockwellii]